MEPRHFSSQNEAEIAAIEAQLIGRGYRLVATPLGSYPRPMEYTKTFSSGGESTFAGPPRLQLTWLE
jgi:hypothetical protein